MLEVTNSVIKSIIFECGHPAGYTDDLGIIADRDQWVPARHKGWYVFMEYDEHATVTKIVDWCKSNLTRDWDYNGNLMIYISSYDDLTLFKMRWL